MLTCSLASFCDGGRGQPETADGCRRRRRRHARAKRRRPGLLLRLTNFYRMPPASWTGCARSNARKCSISCRPCGRGEHVRRSKKASDRDQPGRELYAQVWTTHSRGLTRRRTTSGFLRRRVSKSNCLAHASPRGVELSVLFRVVEIWRAGWDKTTNTYVIDIPCSFKRGTFVAERSSCS